MVRVGHEAPGPDVAEVLRQLRAESVEYRRRAMLQVPLGRSAARSGDRTELERFREAIWREFPRQDPMNPGNAV